MLKASFSIHLILFLFIGGNLFAQTCPSGNLTLTTQSQVDSFPILYPNCHQLPADLDISGDVANLDSLYQIDSIFGGLKVTGNNSLKDFWGLHNLKYFGGQLTIFGNDSLINFRGLKGLKKIDYLTISNNLSFRNFKGLDSVKEVISIYAINNSKMDSLVGLEGLDDILNIFQLIGNSSLVSLYGLQDINIQTLHIVDSDSLWDLKGLENNVVIKRSLSISGNDGLRNLQGVENFKWIPGSLQITANSKLKNLKEFVGLKYIGEGLTIAGNESLISLWGMDSLSKVVYGVSISDNKRLKNLEGINNLDSIGTILNIRKSDSLISISALSNLKTVGTTISIWQNKALPNLNGLDSVKRTVNLIIRLNNKLNSLWGLRGLERVTGEVRIAENDSLSSLRGLDSADFTSATDMFIYDSPSLQLCAVKSICDYLATGKIAYILNNAPGCMDTIEVSNACGSLSSTEKSLVSFEIYPNPSNGNINLEMAENFNPPYELKIFNTTGQEVYRQEKLYDQNLNLKLNSLGKGVYFISLEARDGNLKIEKLILQD